MYFYIHNSYLKKPKNSILHVWLIRIDEEDNLFDHFIKVEEIEESDESNTMLHSMWVFVFN